MEQIGRAAARVLARANAKRHTPEDLAERAEEIYDARREEPDADTEQYRKTSCSSVTTQSADR